MENILNTNTIDILVRLSIALFLGFILGTERVWAGKTAGMRTYALVSMGAALFVIISEMIISQYSGLSNFDPTRIASQIIVGIGFIGTGLIFSRDSKLMGLTTATGLWVSAGIGMATGFKFYDLAVISTFLTLFIFIVMWFIEEKFRKSKLFKKESSDEF